MSDSLAPRSSRAAQVRAALDALHGCASARAVADHLARQAGPSPAEPPPTVRQVREALRQPGITRLGGGYHALPRCAGRPLLPWLRGRLTRLGPLTVERVVDDVVIRWPHGDRRAVRSWLHQEPPGVIVQGGAVRLPGQRGPATGPEERPPVLHPRPRATRDGCSSPSSCASSSTTSSPPSSSS